MPSKFNPYRPDKIATPGMFAGRLAEHLDDWVSRSTLIQESSLKDSTIDNALRALKAKNVILQDETRQGHYRIPTKSFAVWLRARDKAREAGEAIDAPNLFDNRSK